MACQIPIYVQRLKLLTCLLKYYTVPNCCCSYEVDIYVRTVANTIEACTCMLVQRPLPIFQVCHLAQLSLTAYQSAISLTKGSRQFAATNFAPCIKSSRATELQGQITPDTVKLLVQLQAANLHQISASPLSGDTQCTSCEKFRGVEDQSDTVKQFERGMPCRAPVLRATATRRYR